jgi:ABC-2 type transport system permease protein
MGMSEFSAYAGNEEMIEILESFPEPLMEAFKISSFNLTTVSGYFGMMSTYYVLMLCIHAFLIGNSIISKEERDKTIEYSLSLPVKRSRLISFKLIAAMINCIVLMTVTYAATSIIALKYLPEENYHRFIFLCFSSFVIMQTMFLSMGALLACALRGHKKGGYIGISVILAAYIMSVLADLSETLDFFKHITPFKYFDPVNIFNTLSIDTLYIVISLLFSTGSLIIAYILYNKKDLYI